MKSNEYRKCCVITGDTPYQVGEGESQGIHSATGVLKMGRVVWAKNNEDQTPEKQTSVFAKGVGVILVQSSHLRPTSVAI